MGEAQGEGERSGERATNTHPYKILRNLVHAETTNILFVRRSLRSLPKSHPIKSQPF